MTSCLHHYYTEKDKHNFIISQIMFGLIIILKLLLYISSILESSSKIGLIFLFFSVVTFIALMYAYYKRKSKEELYMYLKKKTKKIMSLFLSLLIAMQLIIPVNAASDFTKIEIFGYSGAEYITIKENVPLRSSPSNKGKIIQYLPEGYPIKISGLYRTNKNTHWVRVPVTNMGSTSESTSMTEAWCYLGNLAEHEHTFINLEDQGYDFEFCKSCGHLRATKPEAYDLSNSNSDLHIGLAVCSAIPVIGNGCDIIDALLSLSEGDYLAASLALFSVLPLLGKFTESIRLVGSAQYIDVATGIAIVGRKAENLDGLIEIFPNGNSTILGKNMDAAFKDTGLERFRYKSGSARHHIVAGNSPYNRPAQKVLTHLGIDLNSAENGVYLCQKADLCNGTTIHAGGHKKAYYESVNEIIVDAYNNAGISMKSKREAVVEALDKIAQKLMNDDMPL